MSIPTQHAPAERAPDTTIEKQSQNIINNKILNELYSAISEILVILNKERQIVFHNKNLLEKLGNQENKICGLRIGEALNCQHASETQGGCGTTESCKHCGAVNAILSSQRGKPDTQECRIIQKDSCDALDLKVKTSQLILGDDEFTIVAISDISHEKRRKALERIFFHDIMNTAVGVRGLSEVLNIIEPDQLDEFRTMIHTGADKLVDEIKAQKELVAAESNELTYKPEQINSMEFLKQIFNLYKMHEVTKDKDLKIDADSQEIVFTSDKTILSRVIGNMTKNALEACKQKETVTLKCEKEGDRIKFSVHNPAFMPRHIQLQVFQRSFSTKGAGRGLGTYSIKLLTERYLKGVVSFTSSEENGTTFFAVYPLIL